MTECPFCGRLTIDAATRTCTRCRTAVPVIDPNVYFGPQAYPRYRQDQDRVDGSSCDYARTKADKL